jgi:hypothetical protein
MNNQQLKSLVETYIYYNRKKMSDYLTWFKDRPSLSEVIRYAALAVDDSDNMFRHQYHLDKESLKKGRAIVLSASNTLTQCKSFDELFRLLETKLRPVKGLGELYVYDVALRIGAYLGLSPEKVYLHRGTRKGAKALGLNHKVDALDVESVPKELRQLAPHEIEDFLCIYKTDFLGPRMVRLTRRSTGAMRVRCN